MSSTNIHRNLGIATFSLFLAATAGAQTPSCHGDVYNCFLLRATAADVAAILTSYDLTDVEDVISGDPVLKMVTGPTSTLPENTLANVLADPLVTDFEMVTGTAVTENASNSVIDTAEPAFLNAMSSTGAYSGPEDSLFTTTLWNGYANQPMLSLLNVPAAHARTIPEAMGTGIVAIIDTGIDPDHPVLDGALVSGYDFILDQAGMPSEFEALDPATRVQDEADLRSIADQSLTTITDGDGVSVTKGPAAEAIIEQSLTTITDSLDLPSGFGHGTMIAGIIRLIAPGALIMPLRAFDGDGTGNIAHIVSAIYYAVDNGASVINMSFSTTSYSKELLRAINYAKANKVLCVSSAGNMGTDDVTYPAAFGKTFGVGSTDQNDGRSDFSNFGDDLVDFAAPGEAIMTIFPGDLYAAAWGTSFSSAIVSGALALMHNIEGMSLDTIKRNKAAAGLEDGAVPLPGLELGDGRIDVDSAVECGLEVNNC